ncbi:MAG: VOC family protein [Chloroflexi bacterium]|nr:VOC family protein [Chloroflexota bacterium]MBV9547524.1 VOC family protein [Chloroflexota bacterium]
MDWKLEVVVVPVSDVDRAKHFYADQVGFHLDVDRQISDTFRVVQLTPRGSACSITLMSSTTEMAPGTLKGLQLVVSDVDAAHKELVERGVDVTPVRHIENGEWQDGHGEPWNSFIFFSDPDGNSWTVQEKPAE